MGQVFEAHDTSLDRRVAIKAAWPHIPGPGLRNEARALAAFRHPSLVTVYGLGVHRSIDYIIMERIYGVSLQTLVFQKKNQRQRFEVDEVRRILLALAEGLAVVHRAGIAHRDVKPGNVMLTPDQRVVLMDFGLFLPEFEMAQQSFIAGSPPYMAPEALTNTLSPGSGPAVDLFALGVTAWELLTLELPREADDVEALYEMLKTPLPDIRTRRPDVPEPLARLVAELCAFDPADRPPSAEHVAWSLRRIERAVSGSPGDGPAPVRLLVVDDDRDVARVISFYAQRVVGERAEIRVAHDGEQALEAIRSEPPDIMLLDLHMPRLNGIEVCMLMRGEGLAPHCKIIGVSAGAQEHDRQLLFELGVEGFVLKGPGLQAELESILRRMVPTSTRAGR